MQQEQHRSVAHPRQAGAEPAVEALLLVLVPDSLLYLLPFHAEGRVGKHVVEPALRVAVVAQGVAGNDVGDILALDEHVRLADGVGLVVEFLPVQGEPGLRVVLQQIFARHREHAAGAGGGVVEGAHDGIAG